MINDSIGGGHHPHFFLPGLSNFQFIFDWPGGFGGLAQTNLLFGGFQSGFHGSEDHGQGDTFTSLLPGTSSTVTGGLTGTVSPAGSSVSGGLTQMENIQFIGGNLSVTGAVTLFGASDLYKFLASEANTTLGGGASGGMVQSVEHLAGAASLSGADFPMKGSLTTINFLPPDHAGTIAGVISLTDGTQISFIDITNSHKLS
jgi:hypothetical protein